MDRRNFVLTLSGLALASRAATSKDKSLLYSAEKSLPNDIPPIGVGLKALAEATHIGELDLPFVEVGPKTKIQLLMVDLTHGIWTLRTRFEPGAEISTHYHTGPVLAFTFSGEWYYKEYPEDVNRKGSFLFEPAHSLHTLKVADTNKEVTDVWFSVTGANLNLEDKREVESVVDARSILDAYRNICKSKNLSADKVLVLGEDS
jgi:quercetin dioxygenase-like cupin family protein